MAKISVLHLTRIGIMILFIAISSACAAGIGTEITDPQESALIASDLPSNAASPSPSQTIRPRPTNTASATTVPIYAELRGQVIPEKLSCRFGPGAAYLYKYGILATTNIEILGRMESGEWLLVQAIGGKNPCWVKAEFLAIDGDPQVLAPQDPHVVLVWSPYYSILTGAITRRDGDNVTLSWHPLVLFAGDDSEQVPYVVESWLCQDGELRFAAIGAYYPEITARDEEGCEEISHARVAGAEKHGYTAWADFAWPEY